MERKYGNNEEAINVAKRAMYLAWKASSVVGMGVLQDKGEQPEDEVWKHVYRGSSEVCADYVFGRMMKFDFSVKENTIRHDDGKGRADYQSWCYDYPTYAALFDAAEAEVLKQAA